jgi:hypothetical protein
VPKRQRFSLALWHAIGDCQNSANLSEIGFFSNAIEPPLDRASGTIDFLFGLSVMTHLPEDLQRRWIVEARRLLSPKGIFAFTFRGPAYRRHLDRDELLQFDRAGCVVRGSDRPGTNGCNSYNSDEHIQRLLADDFDVAEHWRQPHALRTRRASTPLHPLQDLVVCTARD